MIAGPACSESAEPTKLGPVNTLSESSLSAALKREVIAPVKTIASVLKEAGHDAWLVGGCVRDVALGLLDPERPPAGGDWDLATSAEPQEVKRLFRKVIPTGIQHGTVTVVIAREHFELTTLRGERGHSDGRRPDEVFFVDDIDADLARRDFTVNAIAYHIMNETLSDPFGGISDLLARKLRAVGHPQERFSEDGLRVLRCARFCATLDFDIEEKTAKAIYPSLDSFRKVASERVQQEWFKALGSKKPSRFLRESSRHGLLKVTAPELFSGRSSYLALEEAGACLDESPGDAIERLALLICAGTTKSPTPTEQNQAADRNAAQLGKGLKLSRRELEDLRRLSLHHRLPESLKAKPSPSLLRRYIADVGRAHIEQVLRVQRSLDRVSDGGSPPSQPSVADLLLAEARSHVPLTLKELAVGGQDLLNVGVPRGPELGQTLAALLEAVLDDPKQNEPTRLLELARKRASSSS